MISWARSAVPPSDNASTLRRKRILRVMPLELIRTSTAMMSSVLALRPFRKLLTIRPRAIVVNCPALSCMQSVRLGERIYNVGTRPGHNSVKQLDYPHVISRRLGALLAGLALLAGFGAAPYT